MNTASFSICIIAFNEISVPSVYSVDKKKHPRTTRGGSWVLREGVSPDGETKGREHGGDGGQSNVDDDAPLVFRILSHSFLLMML